jgi:23S rRNA A1618 N6-methylase RlmF
MLQIVDHLSRWLTLHFLACGQVNAEYAKNMLREQKHIHRKKLWEKILVERLKTVDKLIENIENIKFPL